MSTIAEVRLWGTRIGAVSLEPGARYARFQYDEDFIPSGIEVSPRTMPLSSQVYQFPELPLRSFHGLPGLLADSLPDRFGNALINTWLATQGRSPDSFNAVERLCYTGNRGMGALEFYPPVARKGDESVPVNIEHLVQLASKVILSREELTGSFSEEFKEDTLMDILRVGTSAGGARAKAVIAWNRNTEEVRSGQLHVPEGFEHWLIKFDGVRGNRDRELADPAGFGVIEYAYYLMARDAGITMSESRLLEENGRRHFMTKRFDRTSTGDKIHMQSLGGLAHYDFNMSGAYGYEQALQLIRGLGMTMETVEEQFRRMVFNIVARNQDDHVKNIAFLMDRKGTWSLAPAFDVTHSYNPSGEWTSRHQMTLNGKQDQFLLEDFVTCAGNSSMKRGRAESILEDVISVVSRWEEYATQAGLAQGYMESIRKTHRLDIIS